MRLGLISDTHGKLRPEVQEIFRGVHQVIHCGDVGSSGLLDDLARIAPVSAVYGNTDGLAVRLRCQRVVRVVLGGLVVVATHGDQWKELTPKALSEMFTDADIIAYGHTHEPFVGVVGTGTTVINPGAATHPRGGYGPSVGLVDLEPGAPPKARIIPLDSA